MEALHRQVDRTEPTRTGPADTLDLHRLYNSLVTDPSGAPPAPTLGSPEL
jgi:putative GTP pyrophosphokinase